MGTNKKVDTLRKFLIKKVFLSLYPVIFLTVLATVFILRSFIINKKLDQLKIANYNYSVLSISEVNMHKNNGDILVKIIKNLIILDKLDYPTLNIFINELLSSNKNIAEADLMMEKSYIGINQDNKEKYLLYKWYTLNGVVKQDSSLQVAKMLNYYNLSKQKNKDIVLDFEISKDKILLPIVFPINYKNTIVGCLILKINMDIFKTVVEKTPYDITIYEQNTFKIIYSERDPAYKGADFNELYSNIPDHLIIASQVYKQKDEFLIFTPFVLYSHELVLVAQVPKNEILDAANRILIYAFLFLTFLVPILLFSIYTVNKYITERLKILIQNIESIQKGQIYISQDNYVEIAELQNFDDKLRFFGQRIVQIINILAKISEGDFSKRIESISDEDRLSEVVNKLIENIQTYLQEQKKAIEVKKEIDWIREGIAQVHQALQSLQLSQLTYQSLAENYLKAIIKYTDAFLSSFFIYDKEKNVLQAVAVFAYDQRKAVKKTIKLGEGLIGAVAQEKKLTYYKKIPHNYHTIITGLGEIRPQSLLFIPIIYENLFYGVIELAYIRQLQDFEIDFLKQTVEVVGLSMKNVKTNIENRDLLDQYEKQSKHLKKVQKDLEKQIQKLKEHEKELTKNERKLQTYYTAINNTLLTIEYKPNGDIIFVNKKFLEALKYQEDDIKGKNLFKLTSSDILKNIMDILERLKKGEKVEGIVKRYTKYGEERYFYATYTPFYTSEGVMERIIFLAFDITEFYVKLQDYEKEIRILKKQIKLLL